MNLAHQRRTAGDQAKGHLSRMALDAFPGPVPFHALEQVERLVRVLRQNEAGGKDDDRGCGNDGGLAKQK